MSAVAENLFPAGFDSGMAVSGVAWLDRRRAQALGNFHAGGIPHRRIEEWKYSDLRSALDAPRASAEVVRTAADPFAAIAGARLLMVDGRLDTARSDTALPEGVEILDLAALDDDAPAWMKSNFGGVLKEGGVGQD